jgi:hypothetical protein
MVVQFCLACDGDDISMKKSELSPGLQTPQSQFVNFFCYKSMRAPYLRKEYDQGLLLE